MLQDTLNQIYSAVLVPLSVMGVTLNIILLWTWFEERYKFNRFILKTLAFSHIVYITMFHVWYNSRSSYTFNYVTDVSLFTLRMYNATLYVFLTIMQYFYSANLIHYHAQPLLVKRARIIIGLVGIGLSCIIIRFLKKVMDKKVTDRNQIFILAAIFRVFMYNIPQLVSLIFVVKLFFNVRRYQLLVRTSRLEQALSLYFLENIGPGIAPSHQIVKTKVVSAATHIIARLSVAEGRDAKLSTQPKLLPTNTYKQLRNNLKLELHFTKAVMLLAIPPMFIYIIGFIVETVINQMHRGKRYIVFTVLDVLQFSNAIFTPLLLIAMLQSFRHIFFRKTGQHFHRETPTNVCTKRVYPSRTFVSSDSNSTRTDSEYSSEENECCEKSKTMSISAGDARDA